MCGVIPLHYRLKKVDMDLQNIITKYSFLKIRFWELLAFAGVFPAIATVLGFIGRFSWFLDLFSHFGFNMQ